MLGICVGTCLKYFSYKCIAGQEANLAKGKLNSLLEPEQLEADEGFYYLSHWQVAMPFLLHFMEFISSAQCCPTHPTCCLCV